MPEQQEQNQQSTIEVQQIRAPRNFASRKIDFLSDDKAFQTAVMGALGFSYKAISNATGLNKGKIKYRLKLSKIKLRNYRDGTSPFSRLVMARTEKLAAKQLSLQIGQ